MVLLIALTSPPPVRATARYTLLPLAESLRQTPSTCTQLRPPAHNCDDPWSSVSIGGGLLTSWDPKIGDRRIANEYPGSGIAKTKITLVIARGTVLTENKRFSHRARARVSTKRAKYCLPHRHSRENVYRGTFPLMRQKKLRTERRRRTIIERRRRFRKGNRLLLLPQV